VFEAFAAHHRVVEHMMVFMRSSVHDLPSGLTPHFLGAERLLVPVDGLGGILLMNAA
jgi:hypothetical protein